MPRGHGRAAEQSRPVAHIIHSPCIKMTVHAPIMSSPAAVADKFVVVAKLLTDQRVIELNEKVRKLELDIFWLKHNYQDLCVAMKEANLKDDGPKCGCDSCVEGSREYQTVHTRPTCAFKPYFEGLLAECGLTVTTQEALRMEGEAHACMRGTYKVPPTDVHFVMFGGTSWEHFTFGTKLWKARSAKDPELAKLVLLLQKLYSYESSDELSD